ncbi:MAG: protein-signal peptide and transmembrane prediction [Planctomycetaceae bacterium]|nr:protein-signal peptide and transmembrane prediction [Planctomycetaceae bacterium]
MMRFLFLFLCLTVVPVEASEMQLVLRQASVDPSTHPVTWKPQQTAAIVCDMWDQHWCAGASQRVAEMAPPMNEFLKLLRSQGVLIVHAPSTCVDFYEKTAARRHAQEAPQVEPPAPMSTSLRWGTNWVWPDPTRETDLPIDDSNMGCDCARHCTIHDPWTRQIAAIQIDDEQDAISDNGQELCNLFAQHEIQHVMIMGVHLNMCVLGRPFGIRQLVKHGRDVVLVRDLTDTMYDHRMRPFVNHFQGTDLVIEHIEKFWCPTITSDQITGGPAFRFANAPTR